MNRWRPEGWERTRETYIDEGGCCQCRADYEAGATAMLEALRSKDEGVLSDLIRLIHIGLISPAVSDNAEDSVLYRGVKGRVVFIPDDGGEDDGNKAAT